MISRSRAGMRLAVAGLLVLAETALAAPALAAGTVTSAADEKWLMAVHQSHLAQIVAGEDARRFATDDDVQDMGKELIVDHVGLDETVNDLARKYDVFLPTEPNEAQRAKQAELRGTKGQAYDAAWLRSQIAEHQQMKAAAAAQIRGGEAADVVAAARTSAPIVQRHLDELTRLSRGLGLGAPSSVAGGTGGQAAAATAGRFPGGLLTALGAGLLGAAAVAGWRRRRAVT